MTLTIGVQAETRIVPAATKPSCPFPAQLDLVPPMDNGKLAVGLPIDLPFTDLNKLLEAQLKGHHYPEGGSAPVDVEVLARTSPPPATAGWRSCSRSRRTSARAGSASARRRPSRSGASPTLDTKTQILRLTDLSLAVELEAAFGLLGAAARAAVPYLQKSARRQRGDRS